LTHDLFKNVLLTFDIDLQEIIINNLQDGIFYAKLICLKNGEVLEIDSRTSDALAMAVRFDCPIYTYEFILDRAGVVLEETEEGAEVVSSRQEVSAVKRLSSYSVEELNQMLEEVLANEDYERAAEIRDEINRRNQQ
ncbi:MAG: bifunctional nuclease domain-containing protein, partial [Bacteroidota bacterium]